MITKTITRFAYLPTKIDSRTIWMCKYYNVYEYKAIDIIICNTTCVMERCDIQPGYEKWVLIKKTLSK